MVVVVVVVVGVVVESLAANFELNWTLNGATGADGRKQRCFELLLLRLLSISGVSVGHTDFGTDTGFSNGSDFSTTFSTLTTVSWGILSMFAEVEVD